MRPREVAVLGATSFVGRRLLTELRRRGIRVRALARTARERRTDGVRWIRTDLLSSDLGRALAGVEAAVHLVHSMDAAATPNGDFAERDRLIAENVAAGSREAGVRRLVYLGGLGPVDGAAAPHLRSRAEVARILARGAPEIVHARAAMLIGNGCAPWDMLVTLCHRAPLLPMARWLDTPTQPIAAVDAVRALADLLEHPNPGNEAQLGGAEVLTHAEVVERLAALLGLAPPPRFPIGLSPRTMAHLAQIVLPAADDGVLFPLAESTPYPTVVTEQPAAPINAEPLGFEEAGRLALREAGLSGRAAGSGS